MNKTILIAGASGLVGSKLLTNLKSSENHLVLLGRNQIASEKNINQIITDFDNIENLEKSISNTLRILLNLQKDVGLNQLV